MAEKKKLTTAEKLKIINGDIEKWLFNFVKILNNNNDLVPFKVNAQQKDFLKDRSKFNQILKSRQLGFSTLSLGIMLYYAYQIPNSNYLMCCHEGDSLAFLFNRLKIMADSVPDKYRMEQLRSNRTEILFSNGSRISVKVFDKNVGRGYTNQIIHLSEFALCSPTVQALGLVSVEQSLAKNENSMLIIESTADGLGNKFYQLYQDSTNGRSRYKSFFYGWTTKTHLEQFRVEVEEAVEWYKSTNKGRPLSSDPLELTPYERMLLEKTSVTLKQLMWRQYKMLDMKERFVVEYPAFPQEAFLNTDAGVFDANVILQRMYHIPEPLKNVPDLPQSLQKYIGNGLKIFYLPKVGMKYFGGIDVSAGLKLDHSTVSILDSDGEQVCTFSRNDLATYNFVTVVEEIGHYYNYAMLLVERNSYGLDIINRLVKEKNYIQVLKTKKFDKITGRRRWEHGWYNDNISKTKLVNDGREALETGMAIVNCRETLEQMQIYTENNGSYGNKRGDKNFDDLVDAFLLSVQSLKMGRYYI